MTLMTINTLWDSRPDSLTVNPNLLATNYKAYSDQFDWTTDYVTSRKIQMHALENIININLVGVCCMDARIHVSEQRTQLYS